METCDFWKLFDLSALIKSAYLNNKLRKTIAQLSYTGTQRKELIKAVRCEEILSEVLNAVRLNEALEVVDAILLLLCTFASGKTKRTSHCSSEHRKCITDHVTLCSGDIERNPGPVFFFNDWLKEMFALSVRVVHRIEGRRIPWKKLDRPDPSNSKFDRRGLRSLFDEALLQSAAICIPSTHVEEFMLLASYIQSDREPNLDRLEELVETRKLKVTLTESVKQLKSLPPSRQPEIIDFLQRELGYTLSITEARQHDDTNDTESENEEGMEAGEHQEMSREDQAVNKDDNRQMEDDSGLSEQQPRASIEDQISDDECPLESDEEPVAGPSGTQSPLPDDYSQGKTNFSQTEDGVHSPSDQIFGSSGHLSHNQDGVSVSSAAQSPLPDDYSQGKTNFNQTEHGVNSPSDQITESSGHLSHNQDDVLGQSTSEWENRWNDINHILAKEGYPVYLKNTLQQDDTGGQTTDLLEEDLLEQALDQHHYPDNTDNVGNQTDTGDIQVGNSGTVMVSGANTCLDENTSSSPQLHQSTISRVAYLEAQMKILIGYMEEYMEEKNMGTNLGENGLSRKRTSSSDLLGDIDFISKRTKI